MAGPDPLQRIVGVIVPRAVDSIDLNEVIGEIDLNQVLDRVDLDALLSRLDLDAVLVRVDLDTLLARVDLDSVLDRVDLDALLARVDVDAIVARLDLDAVLARVDVDAIVARVDLDAVMGKLDISALMDRVDVNSLVERVDVGAVMERVNLTEIIRQVQVQTLVGAAAGSLGNRVLDLIRRQLVGLDIILTRLTRRLLFQGVGEPESQDGSFTGQLAGGISRLVAFLLDLSINSLLFSGALALGYFLVSLFVGREIKVANGGGIWHLVAYGLFFLFYQWVCLVVAGRTPGMALAGLRVTAPDGAPLGGSAATRRMVVYPFSFILGLGLIGIVFGRQHRALHDVAAPSRVRYDWGDRPAEMPAPITRYFARRGVTV